MEEDLSVLTRKARAPDATMAYGTHADQIADIRYGTRGAQLPLLVLIHGGFWKPQDDREHAEAMSSALADTGWTVLTLEYRRLPGQPDATLDDISAALAALPAKVERHNGKVLLIGHSAGGHLVLWAAARQACDALQGAVALAPAADLELAERLHLGDGAVKGFLGMGASDRPDANPMLLPAPTVPVTIIQGLGDEVVPPSVPVSYCGKFPATRYVELADCGHFALIDPQTPAWPAVVSELQRFA